MNEIESAVKTAIAFAKNDTKAADGFELAVEAIIYNITNCDDFMNQWDCLTSQKKDEIRQIWVKIMKRSIIPNPRKGLKKFHKYRLKTTQQGAEG